MTTLPSRIPTLLSVGTLCALFGSCESAQDRLDRAVAEARPCEPGDTCVLAGGSECICAQPVNADHADEVNAAAEDIPCCDLFGACVAVDCGAFQDLRCEDGVCTGD